MKSEEQIEDRDIKSFGGIDNIKSAYKELAQCFPKIGWEEIPDIFYSQKTALHDLETCLIEGKGI